MPWSDWSPTRPTTATEESIFTSSPVASGFAGVSPIEPPVDCRSMLLATTFAGSPGVLSPVPPERASRIEPASVDSVASPLVTTRLSSRSPLVLGHEDAVGAGASRPAAPPSTSRTSTWATSSGASSIAAAAAARSRRSADGAATTSRSRCASASRTRCAAPQVTVPVQLDLACHTCHGTGAAPGTAPVTCPQCDGSGVVATSQGLFALQQPCPRCRGMGSIVETAVSDVPRRRPRAADEALQGEDPRRREGRHAHHA